MQVLGIDIGGTGIKGALVDVETGELVAERYRLLTPDPSTPKKVAATVAEVVRHFDWHGPVGCGFPAVVKHGVVHTAANVSDKWIGTDAEALLGEATRCPVTMINDADAAGLAEMRFGAGRNQDGIVLLITLGTGIGTAIFVSGHLLPNTEMGHIEIEGKDAEEWAAEIVRKQQGLSWKNWGKQVDKYLKAMEALIWPDLIIVGGGASKKHERFFPYFTVQTPVVPAEMLNEAGIVGAALAAETLPPAEPR
ncbi:MAG: polyphosphate--glucose phosphotransferase [Anaerolineae bacterium]|jgi:polyphosphate glucokinase